MAKVIITVDTVDKTMEVTKDGKTLDNVSSVSVYKYKEYDTEEEKCSMSISMYEEDEEDGTRMSHYLSASEKENLDKAASEYLASWRGDI